MPKALPDPQMTSIEAVLRGKEQDNEVQPTIVVTSHYDTDSLAPSLPSGVNRYDNILVPKFTTRW